MVETFGKSTTNFEDRDAGRTLSWPQLLDLKQVVATEDGTTTVAVTRGHAKTRAGLDLRQPSPGR